MDRIVPKRVIKENEDECYLCDQVNSSVVVPKKPWTAESIFVVGLAGFFAAGSVGTVITFCAPAVRKHCLPFLPATGTQLTNVLRALKGRKGTVLDIGSGDGRIVIEASRRGFVGHGVELNSWLIMSSRYNAWRQGQRATTHFQRKDLWKTDYSKYDNIVIFGVDTMMKDLEQKFEKEIQRDCWVLASRFPLPNWQPFKIVGEGLDTVWVYKHPANTDLLAEGKASSDSESVSSSGRETAV